MEAGEACAAAAAVSKRLGETVATAAKRATELQKARTNAEQAIARAKELLPPGMDFEPPAVAEPSWPNGLVDLVQALQAGPSQPLAEAAKRAAKAAGARKRSEDSQVATAVTQSLSGNAFAVAARLPDHCQPEFWKRYKAVLRGWVERRKAEAGGQVPASVPAAIRRAEELLERSVDELVRETRERKQSATIRDDGYA